MSIAVMDAVWRSFVGSQGELLLALVLADHASDDGTKIFPSVATMAGRTRQSERTVQYQLRKMEASGWLVKVTKASGGRRRGHYKHDGYSGYATEYRINPEWITEHVPSAKVFHVKGAKSAPYSGSAPPVDNSVDSDVKGAESAPYSETKGATDDRIGCNSRQDRVQQLLHPNRQEPSLTITNVVVDNARARKTSAFAMRADWQPGGNFHALLASANVPHETLTGSRLVEFVSYWRASDVALSQEGWEHKLLQRLMLIQSRLDVRYGGDVPTADMPTEMIQQLGVVA